MEIALFLLVWALIGAVSLVAALCASDRDAGIITTRNWALAAALVGAVAGPVAALICGVVFIGRSGWGRKPFAPYKKDRT